MAIKDYTKISFLNIGSLVNKGKRGGAKLEWFFVVWQPDIPTWIKLVTIGAIFVVVWDIGFERLINDYLPRKIKERKARRACRDFDETMFGDISPIGD